jgi:hypothetical protein
MPRYRYALFTLALVALGTLTPSAVKAVQRDLARTDFAENVAAIRADVSQSAHYLTTTAPAQEATPTTGALTLQDFVGTWRNHNSYLRIGPDGTTEMGWRRGGAGVEPGMATVSLDHVDGRTLYGVVLTTNYADGVAPGPFTLTEFDYGIGELMDSRSSSLVATGSPDPRVHGLMLCGPRFEGAPDWFKATTPCGA